MGLALALCAGALLIGSAQAVAGGSAVVVGGSSNGKEIEGRFVKGKIRSDGNLTVGQPETITIRRFPRATKFFLAIEPPPFVGVCQNFTQECVPQPVYPIAGTPPFRTKGKGRATVTFVMPPAYEIFDDVDPTKSHAVSFINGQAVHVHAFGETFGKVHGKPTFTLAEAVGRAVAQVPPTP
jgi:hypothetical protein